MRSVGQVEAAVRALSAERRFGAVVATPADDDAPVATNGAGTDRPFPRAAAPLLGSNPPALARQTPPARGGTSSLGAVTSPRDQLHDLGLA